MTNIVDNIIKDIENLKTYAEDPVCDMAPISPRSIDAAKKFFSLFDIPSIPFHVAPMSASRFQVEFCSLEKIGLHSKRFLEIEWTDVNEITWLTHDRIRNEIITGSIDFNDPSEYTEVPYFVLVSLLQWVCPEIRIK